MNPAAILGLLSDLYEQVAVLQAKVTELEGGRHETDLQQTPARGESKS